DRRSGPRTLTRSLITMILKSLHITNFRCFESASIKFHEKLTVLHAENGAGKTAVLDAAAIALYPFVHYHTHGNIEPDRPNGSGTAGTSADSQRRSSHVGRDYIHPGDVRLKFDTATITAA